MRFAKLIFLFLLIPLAVAHLDDGKDVTIGDTLVDFGYSPKHIQPNKETTMALTFFNKTTKEVIDPEKVWVRISKENQVLFTGTFKPQLQYVSFSFQFPKSGTYDIKVKSTNLEYTFNLNVESNNLFFTLSSFFSRLFSW